MIHTKTRLPADGWTGKNPSRVGLRGSSRVTLSFTQNMSFTTSAQAPSTSVLMGGGQPQRASFKKVINVPFTQPLLLFSHHHFLKVSFECVSRLKRNEKSDIQITELCQTPRCRTFQLLQRLEVLPENTSRQSYISIRWLTFLWFLHQGDLPHSKASTQVNSAQARNNNVTQAESHHSG